MRILFSTVLLLFLFIENTQSQCLISNQSFEEWEEIPYSFPNGMGGEYTEDVLYPIDITNPVRSFLLGFAAFFDPSIGLAFQNDPYDVIGFEQSDESTDGDFSIKLRGGLGQSAVDIYSIGYCTNVPDTVSIDVKHVGNDFDTLSVLVVYDTTVTELPGDASDFDNYSSVAFQSFNYSTDMDFHTLKIPVETYNGNPSDTVYYLILGAVHNDSYFLVDNFQFIHGEDEEPLPAVYINEIEANNGAIEFYNYGNEAVDLAKLFIHSNGQVESLENSTVLCPFGKVIEPDTYVVLSYDGISPSGGELLLSRTEDGTESMEVISYVQWGDSGQSLESIAVEAGKWEENSFGPSFFATGSLEYDGGGFSGNDWTNRAISSLCNENGTGCIVNDNYQLILTDETPICICDGEAEMLAVDFSGTPGPYVRGLIVDREDQSILYLSEIDNFFAFEDLCPEGEIAYHLLSYDGEIAGLEVGNKLEDLYGCFGYSDALDLLTNQINPFEYSLEASGVIFEDSLISVCLEGDVFEQYSVNMAEERSVLFVVDDQSTIVKQITDDYFTFMEVPAGNYQLHLVIYSGELEDYTGEKYNELILQACFEKSANFYLLEVLGEGSGCGVATNDFKRGTIYPLNNIVNSNIRFKGDLKTKDASINIILTDISGQIKYHSNMNEIDLLEGLDVSNLDTGMYILKLMNGNTSQSYKIFKN